MSTPSSCIRCLSPITDNTIDLICETCRVEDIKGRTKTYFPRDHVLEIPTEKLLQPRKAGQPLLPESYELITTLGAGGMGVVYQARERHTERTVAVKMLRPFADEGSRKRFEVEVQSLASLKHPNIVSVYTVDLDRREPYFSMEYASGGTLASRIHKNHRFEIPEAVTIVEQVARAVHSAHSRGIIHRDIKPSNILFDENGTPKIADFGLAKRLLHDEELTHSQAMVGTPGYMAPEQARKKPRPVGPASDVYSLGCTLYTLLTGKPPFRGVNYIDLAAQIQEIPPVPPKQLRPDVPESLNDIVLKCLEKNPEDRYCTAEALADDLKRFLDGEPVSLRPGSRVRKIYRRAVALSSPIFTSLLVLSCVAALLIGPIGTNRQSAMEPAPVAPVAPPAMAKIDGVEEFRPLEPGHPTLLVADRGVPYWLERNWIRGGAGFGRSVEADEACEWQTGRDSLLAFVRDPGTDRYRWGMDLKVLMTKILEHSPNQPDRLVEKRPEAVNVFVGLQRFTGQDGTEAYFAFTFQLIDLFGTQFMEKGDSGLLRLRAALLFLRPGQPAKDLSYTPHVISINLDDIPSPWWRIQFDVSENQIEAYFTDKHKNKVSIGILSRDQIDTCVDHMQKQLDILAPNEKFKIARWQPRAPLGIWTKLNRVAVRNVTIEPLSDEPPR